MGERSRIAEMPDDDPREGRCGCCDEKAGLSESDDEDVTYKHDHVYENDHLVVRPHLAESDDDERVVVYVGLDPTETTPTVVGARRLRDALDQYLGEARTNVFCGCGEYSVAIPQDHQPPEEVDVVCPECENHFGYASDPQDEPDDTYTVEVTVDVDDAKTDLIQLRQEADEATAALKWLQETIDGLGGETGHTSTPWTERLTGDADSPEHNADSDSDYGTPAPSPSDVQERMEHNDA